MAERSTPVDSFNANNVDGEATVGSSKDDAAAAAAADGDDDDTDMLSVKINPTRMIREGSVCFRRRGGS